MNYGPGNVHRPTTERLPLSSYAVAQLDEIPEQNDGRCPYRPVATTRHHRLRRDRRGRGTRRATASSTSTTSRTSRGTKSSTSSCADTLSSSSTASASTRPRARWSLHPRVKRTAFAEEAETTIVVVGAQPARCTRRAARELWAPFIADYEAGKHAEVAERLRELVDSGTEYPMLVYNLACLESLTGEKEDALDHLRRALEQHDDLRNLAKGLRPRRDPGRACVQGARRGVASARIRSAGPRRPQHAL